MPYLHPFQVLPGSARDGLHSSPDPASGMKRHGPVHYGHHCSPTARSCRNWHTPTCSRPPMHSLLRNTTHKDPQLAFHTLPPVTSSPCCCHRTTGMIDARAVGARSAKTSCIPPRRACSVTSSVSPRAAPHICLSERSCGPCVVRLAAGNQGREALQQRSQGGRARQRMYKEPPVPRPRRCPIERLSLE